MKHIVGIAEMKISKDPEDVIVTYALGSCLGITMFDPVLKVGGLIHIMLPLSSIDAEKAKSKPYMFVDTGVEHLIDELGANGANVKRLVVKVAGGASFKKPGDSDLFEIGKRNFTMLRKVLWKKGLMIKAHDVGGDITRNMTLEVATGNVVLKINDKIKTL